MLPIKWLTGWESRISFLSLEIHCSCISSSVWENSSRTLAYEDSLWPTSSSSVEIRVLPSLCLRLLLDYIIVKHIPLSVFFSFLLLVENEKVPTVFSESWKQTSEMVTSFVIFWKMTAFFGQYNKKTRRWQFISHITLSFWETLHSFIFLFCLFCFVLAELGIIDEWW